VSSLTHIFEIIQQDGDISATETNYSADFFDVSPERRVGWKRRIWGTFRI